MTELREKMIREMELRNLSENTQRSYLQAVYGLVKHYMQSPDKLTKEMIEDHLLYLKKEKGNALATVGSAVSGIRFFYNHVVCDEKLSPSCSYAKTPSRLPTVLSQEEIWSIINATGKMKHRLLLMTSVGKINKLELRKVAGGKSTSYFFRRVVDTLGKSE
jgi:integrase/recombinase XerD